MRKRREYRMKDTNRLVDSSDVLGFVHTTKKKEGLCYACRQPIKIGQKYVIVNDFPFLGDPITVHLDEYVADHQPEVILGIRQVKAGKWRRGFVECDVFQFIKSEGEREEAASE